MSDTRWAKVEECASCGYEDRNGQCSHPAAELLLITPVDGIHPNCPLARAGDIPEVKALREAAREMLESPVEFEDSRISYKTMQVECYKLDDLRAALKPFEEQEPKR